MILFLTSSPCQDGDSHIDPQNHFVKNLKRTIPSHARVLFITAAPDDPGFSDYCASSMYASLESCGLIFKSLACLDRRNAAEARTLIDQSDFIILGGGHVPTQNRWLNELAIAGQLKSFHGVIMGISAGSMNCAQSVYAQPEEPGESIDPNYRRFLPGLGLTQTNILPHYQKVRHFTLDGRRLIEDITAEDSTGHCFYAFPDGSYLLQENGRETIYGECWKICDGQISQVCKAGECLTL
ncbi:MAG: Type 1 glutamine amidotransferase-like domain-containing protein [Proteobacteria bacterium]|nr:Type 1 glutamine amidotransferase-like domain-containing protein [Pseudomonadota bacterium]